MTRPYGAPPPVAYFDGENDADRLDQATEHGTPAQWNADGTGLVGPDGRSVPIDGLRRAGTSSLGVTLADFQTLTGCSCTNNGTMELVSGSVSQIDKSGYSIRVTVPAGEASIFSYPAWTAVYNPGNCMMLVFDNETLATDGYINWYAAVESAYTNHYYTTVALNKFGLQATQRGIGSGISDWTVGGGSPTMSTITRSRCNIVAPASEAAVVTFHLQTAAFHTPPIVQIIHDDGGVTGYNKLIPLLNEYGFKAGFSIIGSLIGTANYMTESMLSQIYAEGHDLIPHGATALNTLGLSAALADIESNRNYLTSRGYSRGSEIYVYPNGVEYHSATDKTSIINHLIANGIEHAYIAGGTTLWTPTHGLNTHIIQRYAVNASVNTTTLLNHIDKAWECGVGVTLMLHGIVDSGASGDQANVSDVATIMDGLATRVKDGKIVVLPPSAAVLAYK